MHKISVSKSFQLALRTVSMDMLLTLILALWFHRFLLLAAHMDFDALSLPVIPGFRYLCYSVYFWIFSRGTQLLRCDQNYTFSLIVRVL